MQWNETNKQTKKQNPAAINRLKYGWANSPTKIMDFYTNPCNVAFTSQMNAAYYIRVCCAIQCVMKSPAMVFLEAAVTHEFPLERTKCSGLRWECSLVASIAGSFNSSNCQYARYFYVVFPLNILIKRNYCNSTKFGI